MPPYAALTSYMEQNSDLFEKYNTNEYNPAKADGLLEGMGWKKDAEGFWQDDKGQPVGFDILGWEWEGVSGPTLAELLIQHGIRASWSMPPNAIDLFSKGDYTACFFGHGGSILDPWESLRLYQSASLAIPGHHQANFSKWLNKDYDPIVDEMYITPMEDKEKISKLFRKALEIWLPELPDIPLVDNYHNIALHTQYWTNWPQANPGDRSGAKPGPKNYCNEASWHLTWQLILNELEAVQ